MSTTCRVSSLVALLLLLASVAVGQTIQNPTRCEFAPSPDHSVILPDGSPYVLRYELRVYLEGGAVAVTSADLGKPAPQSDGIIRVPLTEVIVAVPVAQKHVVRIASIGSAGEGLSLPSNAFFTVRAPAMPGAPILAK